MASTPFVLPDELQAREPPEARGLRRDGVRLLVGASAGLRHLHFVDLPSVLVPGDLLVVNTSATLPAAVPGTRGQAGPVAVHFSSPVAPCVWLVELRPSVDATGPVTDAHAGDRVDLPDGVGLTLLAPQTRTRDGHVRLWRASVAVEGDVVQYLQRVGHPISYGYVSKSWPLRYYQTVFAREPGSAEMPSAGRPFTTDLVTALVAGGVVIAPVSLDTGVSSLEAGEPPVAERYLVPPATARLVNLTKRSGGRVIAVGTTSLRLIESATDVDDTIQPFEGDTAIFITPGYRFKGIDGLITNFHLPRSTLFMLVSALMGLERMQAAYAHAIATDYRFYSYGDASLLLP